MAHPEQANFIEQLRRRFPGEFNSARKVLEVGSQNINGSVREFFPADASYLGIDLGVSKDVDLVIPGELIQLPTAWADITISTECFEHASSWKEILENLIRITQPQGLLILTFAGFERTAHGTVDAGLDASPFTGHYYKNLVPSDIYDAIQVGRYFSCHAFEINSESHDTYFWGVRNAIAFDPGFDSLRELEEKLVRARGQLGQSAEKISSLTRLLSSREDEIRVFERSLSERDDEIIAVPADLSEERVQIDQLRAILTDRDSQVRQMQSAETARAEECRALASLLKERDSQVREFQAAISASADNVRALESLLNEGDLRIRECQSAIVACEETVRTLESLSVERSKSMSWRLTLPLRVIRGRQRRLTAFLRQHGLRSVLSAMRNRHSLSLERDQVPFDPESVRVVAASSLFQSEWYLSEYPDVAAAAVDPLLHFLMFGTLQRRNPNPLFDTSWYLEKYPDVRSAAINPLVHFISFGANEGREPNPYFDTGWYLSQYPDVAAAGANPLQHYLDFGAAEGRDPNPVFDSSWYLNKYPDVARAGMNPLHHYLAFGRAEGRRPSPTFDGDWYLAEYPDVAAAGVDPLRHYLAYGKVEGRRTSACAHDVFLGGLFDLEYYGPNCWADRGANPSVHYLRHGLLQGHAPNRHVASLRLKKLRDKPLISVLMPVHNTPRRLLAEAIASVRNQVYENWELLIQDDGSSFQDTREVLGESVQGDNRIKVFISPRNQGIAMATNALLEAATGAFVAFLDHDDLLTPNCLAEIVGALNLNPEADVIYSDQASVDDSGAFTLHQYKPSWSPWMFRGVMYVGHLLVVRTIIAKSVGGFDPEFDFVQDFEFLLRVSEVTSRIVHLPKVLYLWRQCSESVAGGGKREVDFARLQSDAVNAHFERLRLPVLAKPHACHPHRAALFPTPVPVPPKVRLLLMPDGGNTAREMDARLSGILQALPHPPALVTYLRPQEMLDPTPLNVLLAQCDSEVWVFVNPQGRPLADDFFATLTSFALLPGVGAAGPMVTWADGTCFAAGMVLTGSGAMPAMSGSEAGSDGYAGSLSCVREVSALPPDCLALRKEVLKLEGGFLPELGLAYNLLDMGLRCRAAGLSILCVPYLEFRWLPTGKSCLNPGLIEERFWRSYRFAALTAGDPFYNRNFASQRTDYTLPTLVD